jgi:hypothetical protein
MIMYASWSFVLFLFTLNLSLVYEFKIAMETAHLVVMAILFVKLVAYYAIENHFAYSYCKFLFTPWIIYAFFLFDTLINQLLVKNKLEINEHMKAYNGESVEKSLVYSKLNVNFLLHTCLISAWFFLLLAKLVNFFWSEFCRQKRFSL